MIQEDLLTFPIKIVPGPEFNEDSRRLIEHNLRKRSGRR